MIESEYNHIPKEIRDNPRLCELYKHGFDSGKIQFSYIPDLHDHMESEAYGKGLMAGKEAAIIFKLKYGN